MIKFNSKAQLIDKIMTAILYAVSGFFILLLVFLCGYIIINGLLAYHPGFLSFTKDGIGNQIFNTVYLVFLSLVISVPLGIATGIYLAEYAKDGKITETIKVCVETLSSLPSIVLGLFGTLIFVQMMGFSFSIIAGALTLAILNLPLITSTTLDAFKALPIGYTKGSMCIGATKFQTITKVLLPACLPRILTGVILSAGRGFGEAAALLFTAGMGSTIRWEYWMYPGSLVSPFNIFRSGQTLSLYIWSLRADSLNPLAGDLAAFSSAVLVILVLTFSVLARSLSTYLDKKNLGTNKERKKK